jgi:transposase-like protein
MSCRQAIFEHRWPHGFSCRRCGHERAWHLRGRGLFECASCHYQRSLTAGTILSCTRSDLRKWFLAIWLLASTKKAPSAAELSRQLGVAVKTAWLMRRKTAHALARREGELLLRGIVELDEGFSGGKRCRPASRGRRQPAKTMVASAAEQTLGGGLGGAHLRVVADGSAASLSAAARATIAAGSVVQSDARNGYADLGRAGHGHLPCRLSTGADVDR